jgi:hypothetical protein
MTTPGMWDRCVCGHVYAAHEPHCVVTYHSGKRSCPANCRAFVLSAEAGDTELPLGRDLQSGPYVSRSAEAGDTDTLPDS